ncbi:unnamed protein product, partial [Amoebophrya sp. A25]
RDHGFFYDDYLPTRRGPPAESRRPVEDHYSQRLSPEEERSFGEAGTVQRSDYTRRRSYPDPSRAERRHELDLLDVDERGRLSQVERAGGEKHNNYRPEYYSGEVESRRRRRRRSGSQRQQRRQGPSAFIDAFAGKRKQQTSKAHKNLPAYLWDEDFSRPSPSSNGVYAPPSDAQPQAPQINQQQASSSSNNPVLDGGGDASATMADRLNSLGRNGRQAQETARFLPDYYDIGRTQLSNYGTNPGTTTMRGAALNFDEDTRGQANVQQRTSLQTSRSVVTTVAPSSADQQALDALAVLNADLTRVDVARREVRALQMGLEAQKLSLQKNATELTAVQDILLVQKAQLLKREGVRDPYVIDSAIAAAGGDLLEGGAGDKQETIVSNLFVLGAVGMLLLLFCIVTSMHDVDDTASRDLIGFLTPQERPALEGTTGDAGTARNIEAVQPGDPNAGATAAPSINTTGARPT